MSPKCCIDSLVSATQGWSVEIAGMKNFRVLGPAPLGCGWVWPLQIFPWAWRVMMLNLVALL